jgi:hypothetical protein
MKSHRVDLRRFDRLWMFCLSRKTLVVLLVLLSIDFCYKSDPGQQPQGSRNAACLQAWQAQGRTAEGPVHVLLIHGH